MKENRKLKVFLCHSKDDKPKVRELYQRLVADGFDAWLDEEKLMPGQEWDLEIRKAVRESDVVVVCLSNGSITKAGYVQKEIRFALDIADEQPEDAIFLIPARLENCEVPSRLVKWQWVDLFEEKGNSQLKTSLNLRAKVQGIFSYLPFEPQMVQIPAGRFLMGSTKEQIAQFARDGTPKHLTQNETPQHKVELSEYYIGKYPITNLEYQVFVQDTKYGPPSIWNGNLFPVGREKHPVVNISWGDAFSYCQWLSKQTGKLYRLPTEAEWEKAARGEKGLIYPWGDDFDSLKALTRETRGSSSFLLEVGHFSPQGDSPFGCADMSGNVWEWCNDWFNENEYKQRRRLVVKDPQGPQKGTYRVLRGGAYDSTDLRVRCATRLWIRPIQSAQHFGFRVAHS